MEKEMEIKPSSPLTRLLNRADADGSLYGIMVGEVFKRGKIKRAHIVASLICLSLVLSLSGGIMVADRASAKTSGGLKKSANASSNLLAKAHGSKSSEVVTVFIPHNASMSGGLNSPFTSKIVTLTK